MRLQLTLNVDLNRTRTYTSIKYNKTNTFNFFTQPVSSRVVNMTLCLRFFYIIGLSLSTYAFYVETKAEGDKDYKAMCDISERMSCSKVFLSE